MAASLCKPGSLVFDGDLAERWRIFEEDFTVYVHAAHAAATPDVGASILLNLASTEATRRARRFHYAPVQFNAAGVQIVPAESIQDPECLLNKFKQLCELRINLVMERHNFFSCSQRQGEPGEAFISSLKHRQLI